MVELKRDYMTRKTGWTMNLSGIITFLTLSLMNRPIRLVAGAECTGGI